ncbi:hypothetical protein TrRE_jg12672 [Triparma retinervis]|uniref:Uncharacterized protein n=1 Tax=Triparma retinervis TaxID=2557542 RepID=A0A9W7E2I5_9STRA|nr:hypothetical protein TrRE_jg12672 [Triparma retinervis]
MSSYRRNGTSYSPDSAASIRASLSKPFQALSITPSPSKRVFPALNSPHVGNRPRSNAFDLLEASEGSIAPSNTKNDLPVSPKQQTPTLSTTQSWKRIKELLYQDRLVVLNFHELEPTMVAVPLSDSHYEKMVDYIVEESASDSDNEVEWQEVPPPSAEPKPVSPTPSNSPRSTVSKMQPNPIPKSVSVLSCCAETLMPLSFSTISGIGNYDQKRFFFDHSLVFGPVEKARLKTVEKSVDPLLCRYDGTPTPPKDIEVRKSGAEFMRELERCFSFLQSDEARVAAACDSDDGGGVTHETYTYDELGSIIGHTRTVTIVVCRINVCVVTKQAACFNPGCVPSSKPERTTEKTVNFYPVKLEVNDDDNFFGFAPYIHYVYCENDVPLYSWQETEKRN